MDATPDSATTQADPAAGWGQAVFAAVCERCDWTFLLPASSATDALQRCPHCYQAGLTRIEEQSAALAEAHLPELAVPYALGDSALDRAIQSFAGGIPYPPADLNEISLRSRLRRIYLPVWQVDAAVRAEWQAEAGFYYNVVSHQDSYAGGGWQSRQVQERRVRWEPRLGRLERSYSNVPAPALEAHAALFAALGTFDTLKARSYAPEALAAAYVRLPDRTPQDAWSEARAKIQSIAGEECRQASRADHIRQFAWKPDFSGQNWTLLLLPTLSTYYLDDAEQPQAVWINAQNGQVHGMRRASPQRAARAALIWLGAAALVFLVSLALAAATVVFPPALALAVLGLAIALALGLAAAIPVLRVWFFNRSAP